MSGLYIKDPLLLIRRVAHKLGFFTQYLNDPCNSELKCVGCIIK